MILAHSHTFFSLILDLKQEIGVRKHQELVLKTSGDSLPGVTGLPMQDSGYAAQGNTPTTPTTPMGKGVSK